MKHHIMVKWNESVSDKRATAEDVRELFAPSTAIDGIRSVEVRENCVDRANRYDIMIVLDMERDALTAWDGSVIHKTWKAEYGEMIAQKAIFDCE